jgi:hypothetical protein
MMVVNLIHDNDLDLRNDVDTLRRDFELLQLENAKYREKNQELEKWIIILTNSFYEGKTSTLENVEWAR